MDDGRPTRTGQKDPSSNSTESTERQAQLLVEPDLIPTTRFTREKIKRNTVLSYEDKDRTPHHDQ